MASAQEQELLRKRLLGWTLECAEITPGLDLGRDLRVAAGPNGIDLRQVDGMDALAQALSIGLTTLLGSDLFNTSFGFDGLNALADEPNPIVARERVRIAVIRLLHKDNRVRRIADVQLPGDRSAGGAAAAETLPGSRVLDVRVVFETISGDPAALSLGKTVPLAPPGVPTP